MMCRERQLQWMLREVCTVVTFAAACDGTVHRVSTLEDGTVYGRHLFAYCRIVRGYNLGVGLYMYTINFRIFGIPRTALLI